MANQFPGSLNNYATGAGAPTLSAAGHAAAHNAVETKLGADNSAVTTSIDYLLKNSASKNPGHFHTGQSPSIFVAASDQSTYIKNKADYVCTGTGDQATIATAIAALPAAGGRIILSEGVFSFNAALNITMPKGLTIEGSGWGTILRAAASLNAYMITFVPPAAGIWAAFRNFKMEGSCASQTAGGGIYAAGALECEFHYLWFYQCYEAGIILQRISSAPLTYGHNNRIINCHFDQGSDSAGSGKGIYMRDCDENIISNCDFQYMCGAGADAWCIHDQTGLNTINNNTFVSSKGGIYLQDASQTRMVGNMFDKIFGDSIFCKGTNNTIFGNTFYQPGDTSSANSAAAVHIDYYGSNQIVGNQFQSHSTNGQTRSLIRDTGTGANIGGFNQVVGNYFQINGTLGTSIVEVDPNSIKNRYVGNHGNGFNDYVTKTANYTATVLDRVILVDATAGVVTITLPAATTGQRITVKKIDAGANAVTVSRAGADTIEAGTTVSLAAQYNSVTLEPDQVSKWYKISTT